MAAINRTGMDLEGRHGADPIHRRWGWFLALGIALVILGVIAISGALTATLISVVTLGWLLMIGGAGLVIHAFGTRNWRGFLASLLVGILYIGLGALMTARPLLTAASLTMAIAAFFIAAGLIRIIQSLTLRHGRWGWMFLNGLISLLLGGMIWAQWPASGLWVIGTFVGIDMLFAGWSNIMLALMARRPPALPA